MRRYEILGRWLAELETLREQVTQALRQRSPLEENHEVEPKLREKWESELKAAVEAEYRRLRLDYLTALQWFFRDVWVRTLGAGDELLALPELRDSIEALADRVAARDAQVNVGLLARTQRLLETNLQEALVLEVALLRLRL